MNSTLSKIVLRTQTKEVISQEIMSPTKMLE